MKPTPQERLQAAERALYALRVAVRKLKAADAPQALERARAAVKSAEGAARHAYGRHLRAQRKAGRP